MIQVDEPVFARKVEDALAFGIEHLEGCFHKVPRSTERLVVTRRKLRALSEAAHSL